MLLSATVGHTFPRHTLVSSEPSTTARVPVVVSLTTRDRFGDPVVDRLDTVRVHLMIPGAAVPSLPNQRNRGQRSTRPQL
jgi:hypothetical protein